MDTHKKDHKIALRYPGQKEIVTLTIKNTASEISKMVKRIKRKAPGEVRFCYEAGVCGFDLKRKIESLSCKCVVIAPSLTPVKPGNKIKTDRRDAMKLLDMFKNGMLTEVYAPDLKQEAAREITRLRKTVCENLMRIRHQLQKFLIRHGYIYCQGNNWTQKHLLWMRSLKFEEPWLYEVFDSYYTEMQHCLQRLDSLDKRVKELAESEPYKEVVDLLKCFHGISTLTAISIITEIFDFGRFSDPRQLMGYLGFIPSEYTTGTKQKKGPIGKNGNKRVRRLLVEVSWHYRHPYKISRVLKQRRENQPQWAIDIADRAGQRLRKRYWYLVNHGKMPCKATVAVARELAGFIWSVFREYELRNMKEAA